MRKLLFGIILALGILCLGAILFYKMYLPSVIAEVIVDPETPAYLPSFLQENLAPYKAPINKGATDFVEELHRREIPVWEVVDVLDKMSEEDIQTAINELKSRDLKSTDEAFDIIASHINADFNIEQLRGPFKEQVNVKTIQKILTDKDFKNYQELLNPSMIKNVAKEILLQKEAEYQRANGL